MTTSKSREAGFTLIELMVTMAIAAVLLMVAVPSLNTYRRNAELTSITNTLVASINTARGEALKRGLSAMVVPINNGSVWTAGWVVFVDTDSSRDYDATKDTLVFTQSATASYIAIDPRNAANASASQIRFDASGYPRGPSNMAGNSTVVVSRTDGSAATDWSEKRVIVISLTGRTRVCKPVSANDAACNSLLTE